jgi:hypothetical protein
MGRQVRIVGFVVLSLTIARAQTWAGTYVGYSLKMAEQKLRAQDYSSPELANMGGISRLVGFVLDRERGDLIIIGEAVAGERTLTLDDFAVALRACVVVQEWPEVSIEAGQENSPDGNKVVRFRGGIDNTRFGNDLLEADVLLKELALGLRPVRILGLESYFSLRASELKRSPSVVSMKTKFWFYPKERQRGSREGVFVLRNFRPGIEARLEGLNVGKATASLDISKQRNELADIFASRMSANFSELSAAYSQIARVHALLRLVALADGIKSLPKSPAMQYWLHEYPIRRVDTPVNFKSLERREKIGTEDGAELHMEGGVELRVLRSRLAEDGDIEALRDIILGSRPEGNSLYWEVPLGNWRVPGYDEYGGSGEPAETNARIYFRVPPGCSLSERILSPKTTSVPPLPPSNNRVPTSMPQFETFARILPQRQSPNVGGVMLSGVAKVGEGPAKIDLTDGNFSLIVNGENARLDPQMFRKFVTALWTVYFGRQDPGTSIDPIYIDPDTGGFSAKHLVRYIGRVVNTDLGRVMREADYQMKKWSVGTERANIPGFKSPDEIAGRSGTRYLSLSRFWLVPEDMRFKSTDNMLLFDSGRMTVKTEVLGASTEEKQADPHNEQFARFFTDHYNQIAQKHAIYQELFDYAKLVALAKYLKESGVPLFWFLMANKDFVLTEDSPGTVDNLAKGSDYWRGLTIQGGVDLATKGRYVFDAAALKAVNEAMDKLGTRSQPSTSLTSSKPQTVPMPFSFGLGPEKYSVRPQHSLSAGKDSRGTLYQTDIALRAEGYMVTPDLLNTLRAEMIRQNARRLLAPVIEKMSEAELQAKLDLLVAPAMEKALQQVDPLLKKLSSLKNREFKTEEECAKAWDDVAGNGEATEWKAYFVKQAHYASDLELVRYFNPRRQENSEFGKGWRLLIPYRVRPADKTPVEFLNAMVPRQMEVENLITGEKEALTFSTNRYTIAGYVPDKVESSRFVGLFLLSDASFRLVDKIGSEFQFDQAGFLTDLMLSDDHRVHIEYADEATDAFDQKPYSIEPADNERIDFLNARIPSRMKVTDLIHNSSEVLTFSKEGQIAGYVPVDSGKSRYKILALLSDASFQLLDKHDNTVSFRPSGVFEGMEMNSDQHVARSISMGNHKISFGYTIDQNGRPLIASARLSKDIEGAVSTYAVKYEYDSEGRLARSDKRMGQATAAMQKGTMERHTAEIPRLIAKFR